MHYLFKKGRFKLYEVDEDDYEIAGVAGNHYCLNTVLLFEDDQACFAIGYERAWAKDKKEALMLADELSSGKRSLPFAVQVDRAVKAVSDRKRKEQLVQLERTALDVKVHEDNEKARNNDAN